MRVLVLWWKIVHCVRTMAKGNTDTLREVQEVQLWENQTTEVNFGSAPPEHAGKLRKLPCGLGFSMFADIFLACRYADNYWNGAEVDKKIVRLWLFQSWCVYIWALTHPSIWDNTRDYAFTHYSTCLFFPPKSHLWHHLIPPFSGLIIPSVLIPVCPNYDSGGFVLDRG